MLKPLHAINAVQNCKKNIQDISVESADRPGLNLLTYYLDDSYDKVIIIDAVYAKVTPGREFYFKAKDILVFLYSYTSIANPDIDLDLRASYNSFGIN
ncbi:MAG: hypothetical protein AB8V03_04125 [Francisella endosymbiont of Hyalomma asiaticum]